MRSNETTTTTTTEAAELDAVNAPIEVLSSQNDEPVKRTTTRKSDPNVARFDALIRQHVAVAHEIYNATTDGVVLSREQDLEGKKSLKSKLAWRMKTAGLLIDNQRNVEADKEAKIAGRKNVDRDYERNLNASAELVEAFLNLK